ncbi:MAG: HAD-IIA family hydrolase [Desulfobacterales bacterium]|nr:MAG: HAD-IIA family hydrolase [Desulfobacterales bacterium]
MAELKRITIEELIERYAVLLLDAYGVLVNDSGAIAGASELIRMLNRTRKPYYLLTNDASKLPQTTASRFQSYGLEIAPDRIITSGGLLKNHFKTQNLQGARCVVLGPDDSEQYVVDAGGRVVSPANGFDAVIIGDEAGFPFVETVDTILTALIHKVERREKFHLLLPNPDLIYPKADRGVGIASGSIALIIEAALQLRYPGRPNLRFARLGKPHAAIFEEAVGRSGTRDMVMIGDQLETDIRGANAFGLDSVLVDTGITDITAVASPDQPRPTYLMHSVGLRRPEC